jgi:hypothetical protein
MPGMGSLNVGHTAWEAARATPPNAAHAETSSMNSLSKNKLSIVKPDGKFNHHKSPQAVQGAWSNDRALGEGYRSTTAYNSSAMATLVARGGTTESSLCAAAGSQSYQVSASWLNPLEREEHELTVNKLIVLSDIYNLSSERLIRSIYPGDAQPPVPTATFQPQCDHAVDRRTTGRTGKGFASGYAQCRSSTG